MNYRLKNTSNTLSFVADGEMVAYISIEPIDNGDYNGDVCFDIKLSAPEGCNLGANYTTTVTISDDDHPLAAAGILGKYNASGLDPFGTSQMQNWTAGSYTLALDFNGASSATAQVSNGTISINTYVIAGIVEQPGYAASGAQTVTLKKVEE